MFRDIYNGVVTIIGNPNPVCSDGIADYVMFKRLLGALLPIITSIGFK